MELGERCLSLVGGRNSAPGLLRPGPLCIRYRVVSGCGTIETEQCPFGSFGDRVSRGLSRNRIVETSSRERTAVAYGPKSDSSAYARSPNVFFVDSVVYEETHARGIQKRLGTSDRVNIKMKKKVNK